jgi:type IV secretory pathway TraG/TraD family ATPase VirD4
MNREVQVRFCERLGVKFPGPTRLRFVAPTRGGKGLLATAQLLSFPHSVVVNDIKGDLFEQTAGFRSRFSDIYVIDPNGFGNRYNPLSGKTNHKDLLAAAFSLLRRYYLPHCWSHRCCAYIGL